MHNCTAARFLAGVYVGPVDNVLAPSKLTEFKTWDPHCTMHELSSNKLLSLLQGRSVLLFGDCWERRMVEAVCALFRAPVDITWSGNDEPFSRLCRIRAGSFMELVSLLFIF